MRSHQRYFSIVDASGKLMPGFITVNNTLTEDPSVVVKGNERVLRARLSDARFFFEEDQQGQAGNPGGGVEERGLPAEARHLL